MNKLILSLLLIFLFLTAQPVHAQYVPPTTPQPFSNLSVIKTVQNPENGQFVQDLSFVDDPKNAGKKIAGPRFLPGQTVLFNVDVKNNGQTNLNNVQVKDVLPDFISFTTGPGTFDSNSKTLNFTIDSLNAGETKSFQIKTTVKDASALPQNLSTCLSNFAQAFVNNLNSQNTAVFCVQSTVLGPTTELPKTGVSNIFTLLFSALGLLVLSTVFFAKYVTQKLS